MCVLQKWTLKLLFFTSVKGCFILLVFLLSGLLQIKTQMWRRTWQPSPVFLPGEFHGQRNLAGYSPRSRKELDTTEQLTHTHTHTHRETQMTTYYLYFNSLLVHFLAAHSIYVHTCLTLSHSLKIKSNVPRGSHQADITPISLFSPTP